MAKTASSVVKKINKEYKLTPKQSVFFHEWLNNGGNGVKAALKAYDTTDLSAAGVIAHDNLKKLNNPMRFYLEYKGTGLGTIADVIDGALNATKWNDFTGEREADHNIRLKAVDKLGKYMGVEPQESTGTNVQVNILNQLKKDKDEYEL